MEHTTRAGSPASNCWECRLPRCWIKALRGAGEQALLLAWALTSHADTETGEAYPSQETLMLEMGIEHKRSFYRALESVQNRLGVEIDPKGKKAPSGQWVTLYRLRHRCGAPWAASAFKRLKKPLENRAVSPYGVFVGEDRDGAVVLRHSDGVFRYASGRPVPPERLQEVA